MAFVRTGKTIRVSKTALINAGRRRTNKGARGSKLRKMVQKIVKGASETKYVANVYKDSTTLQTLYWPAPINLGASGNYYPALPALTQGVGDYQRIGAKVLPMSCKTTLNVGYLSRDLSCNQIMVVIYYGTTKAGKTWQASTPIQSANDLLDNGDGTTGSWGGQQADLLYPINKHMNNAKRIVFRMGKTEGVLNDNGVSVGGIDGAYSTSNGMAFRQVQLNFKPPKALQYDRPTDLWPTNYAPWYAISWCRIDERSTGSSTSDDSLVNVSALNHMYFKDV